MLSAWGWENVSVGFPPTDWYCAIFLILGIGFVLDAWLIILAFVIWFRNSTQKSSKRSRRMGVLQSPAAHIAAVLLAARTVLSLSGWAPTPSLPTSPTKTFCGSCRAKEKELVKEAEPRGLEWLPYPPLSVVLSVCFCPRSGVRPSHYPRRKEVLKLGEATLNPSQSNSYVQIQGIPSVGILCLLPFRKTLCPYITYSKCIHRKYTGQCIVIHVYTSVTTTPEPLIPAQSRTHFPTPLDQGSHSNNVCHIDELCSVYFLCPALLSLGIILLRFMCVVAFSISI